MFDIAQTVVDAFMHPVYTSSRHAPSTLLTFQHPTLSFPRRQLSTSLSNKNSITKACHIVLYDPEQNHSMLREVSAMFELSHFVQESCRISKTQTSCAGIFQVSCQYIRDLRSPARKTLSCKKLSCLDITCKTLR